MFTEEQRERRKQYQHEYGRLYREKLKALRKINPDLYCRKMTPEQKEHSKQYYHERYKNLTPQEKERRSQLRRKIRQNRTPEQRERFSQLRREYRNNMAPEKKEREKRLKQEYRKNLTAEQRERSRLYQQKYNQRKREQKWLERFKAQNIPGTDDMKKKFFCYTCREQFADDTNLLCHIQMHISQPRVVVSRIDKYKNIKHNIKKEIKTDDDKFSFCTQIKQEFNAEKIEIKCEPYEESSPSSDIEIENNLHYNVINIKMEKCDELEEEREEIDNDELSYIRIKKEFKTEEIETQYEENKKKYI